MTEAKNDPAKSDPHKDIASHAASEGEGADEDVPPSESDLQETGALKNLLQRSLPKPEADVAILPAVQEQLRDRSRGKFYNDRWSTSQSRISYGLIAVALLVLIATAYALIIIVPK
jgi:hypothetical protein